MFLQVFFLFFWIFNETVCKLIIFYNRNILICNLNFELIAKKIEVHNETLVYM